MPETSPATYLREAPALFRALNPEQRVAAVGALLLLVSTFGPFSFVEAAEVLVAIGVLGLLRARAQGRRFHLPLGDGTAIAAAGVWAGLLIIARLFDRPLGQNLLALACAAILAAAGARERAKRPADDLPPEEMTVPPRTRHPRPQRQERRPLGEGAPRRRAAAPVTPAGQAAASEEPTEMLPPPEFIPPGREPPTEAPDAGEPPEPPADAGEQLTLPDDEDGPA
jgi:hypothetical protein